jgi:hypothetical protein
MHMRGERTENLARMKRVEELVGDDNA